jgi:hypothetical protein
VADVALVVSGAAGYDDPAQMRWSDVFRTGIRLWKPRWRAMAWLSLILTAPLPIAAAVARSIPLLRFILSLADIVVLMSLATICLVRRCWLPSVGDAESLSATIRSQQPSWGSAIVARLLEVLILAAVFIIVAIPYSVLLTILGPVDGQRRTAGGAVGFVIATFAVIFTSTKLFAISQGIVVEGLSGKRAVGRSWALTRGRSFWQSVRIVSVTTTISVAAAIAIAILVRWILGGTSVPDAVFGAIAVAIMASFTSPLSAAILTVLYVRQRSREPAISLPLALPLDTSGTERKKGRRPNIGRQR